MSHGFFATIFYIPLYNGLIFLLHILPGANAGIAIILFTILVKLILFPLSRSSIKTQLQMKQIEPELKAIREKYTDKQEQARQTMQLYKARDINPLASLLLIIIQFPILIALYRVFLGSGLPKVDISILYSFVKAPALVGMHLLTIDLAQKSIILALLAAISQYIQINLSLPKRVPKNPNDKRTFGDDFAQSLNVQMKYVMPIFIFLIAYRFSAVIALYLVTSNIFMIVQELFVKRKMSKKYTLSV